MKVELYKSGGKRLFDLLLAGPAVVVLAPLLALLAAAVYFDLGRPVLFRQQRPGRWGRPFVIYKFRTMRQLRDEAGRTLPDHSRLTALGRFLRRFSLDEVPELWNVLKGDMSLVGPRPLLMQYLERYTAQQMRRHDVRPGITGWAQVNGRNAQSWEERFAFDLFYVAHLSFSFDLKILIVTVWKVLKGEGISAPGHSTMPEFEGPTLE